MKADRFYVGGAWIEPVGNERVRVRNPADLSIVGEAILGVEEDADRAVAAASTAFEEWRKSPVEERVALVRRMRAAFETLAPKLEEHLVREVGLTRLVAQGQTRMSLTHFDGVLDVLPTYAFTERPQAGVELIREPVGTVAAITSWNAPVSQMLCKAVPAIAAGCTVVVKPSEQAPLCGIMLAEAMAAADIPAGVFNLVNGRGATCGKRLAEHPLVDMVSITGSVAGGAAVARAGADTIKRIHQELGGKSPNIILRDADLEAAVSKGVQICMMAAGQACAAPSRMIVPVERFKEAAALAVAAAERLVVGPPDDPAVDFGPLANEAQFHRVTKMLEQAVAEGQPLLAGGTGRPAGLERGYYVKPTIFGPVSPDAAIAREEIFGPVLCIQTYTDEEDAIRVANATDYGLSAYIETNDAEAARRIARALRTGYVNLNYPPWSPAAPFGGCRRSGNGKQYGVWGFEEFLEIKAFVG